MYAFVKHRREPKAELSMVNEPQIETNEVLVKVKMAAICGTDVHFWNFNEWAQARLKKFPLIIGHEMAGEVVEIGDNVTTVHVGDMV